MMRAQVAHAEFRHLMRENGVRVLTVREILAHGVERVRDTVCNAHQSLTNRSPIAHQSLTNISHSM